MAPKVSPVNILGVPEGNTLPTCLGQWHSRQYSLVYSIQPRLVQDGGIWEGLLDSGVRPTELGRSQESQDGSGFGFESQACHAVLYAILWE